MESKGHTERRPWEEGGMSALSRSPYYCLLSQGLQTFSFRSLTLKGKSISNVTCLPCVPNSLHHISEDFCLLLNLYLIEASIRQVLNARPKLLWYWKC